MLTGAWRACYTTDGVLSPAGRKDGAWLLPSFAQKGVIVMMTDYEMLSTFIMILMLVLAVMSYYKNDR